MNIKELNKLIKEELDAFLENEDELDSDIEVTTDEPAAEEDPLDLLRQIYDMLKPVVDDEGEDFEGEEVDDIEDDVEGEVEDLEDEEGEEEEEDEGEEVEESRNLNESVNVKARFQKLANIKK
jgi:hypothetical protein|tara:strand:- start:113 stop:481 length:369 start_codon:yes stop_codon:yes gene_type:complete